jgi:light-regulated signal transduction histidine kinase (bacteriophytochrome)
MNSAQRDNIEVKQFLLSIIGNSPFGIIAIDFNGYVTIINQTMLDYLGHRESVNDFLNQPLLHVMKGIPELDERISACVREGRKSFDLAKVSYESNFFSIKARVVLNGMLLTVEDITAAVLAEEKLLERTRQLEESNKELEQFAYISSHDLQEPLVTMIGFTNLLSDGYSSVLDDHARKCIDYINSASTRMSKQIKSLLNYSRIGRSKTRSLADGNELVAEVIRSLESNPKFSVTTFEIGDLPSLELYREEFQSLMQNLISNAMKFTGTGVKPLVQVSATKAEGEWCFVVRDNGIGISKEHHDRIFVIFQRLHNRNEYEGTGIGLAQCRKIVDMHNGHIWVESEPGVGSSFIFTIKTDRDGK